MSDKLTGKTFDIPLFKRTMSYVKPYKGLFFGTAIFAVVLAALSPVRPYLIQIAIDDYVQKMDGEGLWFITIIMLATLVFESILQYFYTLMANVLAQNVIRDLRNQVFNHINNFKLTYFDNTPIGQLVTRTVSDIETIADVFSQGVLVIIGDLLKLIVIIGVMFYTDWFLALVSLLPIPILLIATSIFKRVIKKAFQEVREQVSKLNTFVQEHITGMFIVQMFNREEVEMNKFEAINKKHRNAHIKTVWAYSVFFPVVEILAALSIALLVWFGFRGIAFENQPPGLIFSFILYIYMMYRPIRQLADRFNTLQLGLVSSNRVFKVLDTKSTIEDNGNTKPDAINGDIDFNHVSFAYADDDYVLKNISFSVKQGQSLALVGATGAGKSSIINLIGRYYSINKGDINIDGINIKDYDLKSLRSQMAIVLQDVFLFSDTILNNITLFNDTITKEQVIEAAKKVGAHDFIMELPNNYNYHVKERGVMLSAGQRQLIAFIRAYVHNPKILILDEATSSVDSESEALIQHATDVLTENRTSIIVAHRLSTIQKSDNILVLDKGEIVERGNHFDLLKQEGYYKRLFDYQFDN